MKTLVIIPAYNEEECIKQTIQKLKESAPEVDYVIINDCSKDSTLNICKENHFNVISLPVNLGIGGAVQTGYCYAKEYGYDIAIQMDADGQHDPTYLPKLIQAIEKGADLVIGSRFIEKEGFQSTLLRRMGINFYSKIIKWLTGIKITDTTSGFRAVNRKVIELFADSYPVDYPEPETNAILAKKKYTICEVPVQMAARNGGVSSITPSNSIYYAIKVGIAVMIACLS